MIPHKEVAEKLSVKQIDLLLLINDINTNILERLKSDDPQNIEIMVSEEHKNTVCAALTQAAYSYEEKKLVNKYLITIHP
jgi:hypothetical protein